MWTPGFTLIGKCLIHSKILIILVRFLNEDYTVTIYQSMV